jgi:hypothetical protein
MVIYARHRLVQDMLLRVGTYPSPSVASFLVGYLLRLERGLLGCVDARTQLGCVVHLCVDEAHH